MTFDSLPIKNNNLRVNFCGGHFDLIGGDNNLSKEPILFTACFSHGKDSNEIQWDNKHQQKQQPHTVYKGRSLHWTWRRHGPMGGGGLERLCIGEGTLSFTSFVSFK